MSQTLKPLPPFINDKFTLSVIVHLGQPTTGEMREYIKNTYNLATFPHALQYFIAQLKSLMASGYIDAKREKRAVGEVRYFITDEARPIVERMLRE